jgi:flagellar motor switch protein FliG
MAEASDPQPNVRDAAVLLLSLGELAAADVLRHLGPKDVQRVGAAMAAVGQVSVAEVSDTLSTFLNEALIKAAGSVNHER